MHGQTRLNKKRMFKLLISGIFGSGVILGIMACHFLTLEQVATLKQYVSSSITTIMPGEAASIPYTSFVQANVVDVIRLFFWGLCVIGAPLIIILLFIKGFSLGFVFAIMIEGTGFQGSIGILFCLIFVKALYILLLISAAICTLRSSFACFNGYFYAQSNAYLKYVAYFLMYLLAIAIAGYVEGFLLQNHFLEWLNVFQQNK